jgi:hypothetical protein
MRIDYMIMLDFIHEVLEGDSPFGYSRIILSGKKEELTKLCANFDRFEGVAHNDKQYSILVNKKVYESSNAGTHPGFTIYETLDIIFNAAKQGNQEIKIADRFLDEFNKTLDHKLKLVVKNSDLYGLSPGMVKDAATFSAWVARIHNEKNNDLLIDADSFGEFEDCEKVEGLILAQKKQKQHEQQQKEHEQKQSTLKVKIIATPTPVDDEIDINTEELNTLQREANDAIAAMRNYGQTIGAQDKKTIVVNLAEAFQKNTDALFEFLDQGKQPKKYSEKTLKNFAEKFNLLFYQAKHDSKIDDHRGSFKLGLATLGLVLSVIGLPIALIYSQAVYGSALAFWRTTSRIKADKVIKSLEPIKNKLSK